MVVTEKKDTQGDKNAGEIPVYNLVEPRGKARGETYSNGFPTKPWAEAALLLLGDMMTARRRSNFDIRRGGNGILSDALPPSNGRL